MNRASHFLMAEREGFEPSEEVSPLTRLAGERLQPARPSLLDFDESKYHWLPVKFNSVEFPGGGSRIRTHGALTLNGFQDRRLQPLGHPSGLAAFLSTILVKTGQYFLVT